MVPTGWHPGRRSKANHEDALRRRRGNHWSRRSVRRWRGIHGKERNEEEPPAGGADEEGERDGGRDRLREVYGGGGGVGGKG